MASEKVEAKIQGNKVVVFSKSYCPYCKKAKDILKKKKIEFVAIELDEESDGDAMQNYLAKTTGQRTVPNIFINQSSIGGCSDLEKLASTGKLVV